MLIVDDEPHVRTYNRMLLAGLGVTQVWEAGSGAEGIAKYTEHRPSVVLMDVNMPAMTGEVMMTRLAEIDPAVSVIVMTSDSQGRTVRAFLALGAIGYVLKHTARECATASLAEALDSLVVAEGEAEK